jgi:hypothetical protein
MSVLIVLAIVVLAATALLILASFLTSADQARGRDSAPTGSRADQPEGPDRRAGGPGFRRAALQAAQDTAPAATQRRRLSSRRRRALDAAQAAHVADLATDEDV